MMDEMERSRQLKLVGRGKELGKLDHSQLIVKYLQLEQAATELLCAGVMHYNDPRAMAAQEKLRKLLD